MASSSFLGILLLINLLLAARREQLYEPSDLGLSEINPSDIFGGDTVEESAKIFMNVLEGKGTRAQNDVVIANAGMELYCGNRNAEIEDAINNARETLVSGKALAKFKRLLDTRHKTKY